MKGFQGVVAPLKKKSARLKLPQITNKHFIRISMWLNGKALWCSVIMKGGNSNRSTCYNVYCATNKALQCRDWNVGLHSCKEIFPRKQINAKDTLDLIKRLDPPPVFIAFLGLSKMSSSCPICRPGPTGP